MLHPEARSVCILISSASCVTIAYLCPVATKVKVIKGAIVVANDNSGIVRVGILHMVYEPDSVPIGRGVSAEVIGSKAVIASKEQMDIGSPLTCRELLRGDESGRDRPH